jgi:hypothetical protein
MKSRNTEGSDMAQPARKQTEKVVTKRASSRHLVLSKKETAKKLATMIEEHMTELGMSEEEKNRRVAKFGERVGELS